MRTVIRFTLAALLCSCVPPTPEDGDPGQAGAPGASGERGPAGPAGRDAVTAGARLRPLYLVGSDGSRLASFAYYDNERRERCFIQAVPGAAPDSMERICAPWGFKAEDAGRYVRFAPEQ